MRDSSRSADPGRLTSRRTLLVCAALLLLLAVVLLIASTLGSQRLPLGGLLCSLTGKSDCGLSSDERAIIFDIRLPRIFLAGAVGMRRPPAGARYPALLRNPPAAPYLLQVRTGPA